MQSINIIYYVAVVTVFISYVKCTDDLNTTNNVVHNVSKLEIFEEDGANNTDNVFTFQGSFSNSTEEDQEDDYDDVDLYEQFDANVTYENFEISGRFVSSVAVAAQFPFAVYLSSTTGTGTRGCTGALITREYIITAASCVYDASAILAQTQATVLTTVVTAADQYPGTAIVHPKFYSKSHRQYDIALVKLSKVVVLGPNVGLVSISYKTNSDESKDLVGKSMLVLGYGLQAVGGATATLSYANMKVMTTSRCSREMKIRNVLRPGSTQNCLDTEDGAVGMCTQDDVGGPVLYKFDTDTSYTLVGVTNYFYACQSATPNLFTRIGPYIDWIRKYIPTYG